MDKPILHYFFKARYAAVFCAIGLTMFFMSKGNKSMARRSAAWPSTQGVALSSEFKRAVFVIDSDFAKRHRRSKYYKLKVTYEYEMDGKTYTSDRVSYMSNYIHRDWSSGYGDKYKKGMQIDVFCDPNNAQEAVLIKGTHDYNKNPHVFTGLLICALGSLGMVVCAVKKFVNR